MNNLVHPYNGYVLAKQLRSVATSAPKIITKTTGRWSKWLAQCAGITKEPSAPGMKMAVAIVFSEYC